MVNTTLIAKPFVDYSDIGREEFMAEVASIFHAGDVDFIADGYSFSKYSHRTQERDDGRRYFDHPKEVARILYKEFGVREAKVIVTGLGHDIKEDTWILSQAGFERLFGVDVAQWIRILSKIPKQGYNKRLEEFGEVRVWLVKLADNLHNTRTLDSCPLDKRTRKLAETKELYLPLIDRVAAADGYYEMAIKIRSLFDQAIGYQESLIAQARL